MTDLSNYWNLPLKEQARLKQQAEDEARANEPIALGIEFSLITRTFTNEQEQEQRDENQY